MNPRGGYQPRHYRRLAQAEGLVSFGVTAGESDLRIWAERQLRAEAAAALQAVRRQLIDYMRRHPEFAEAFEPLEPLAGAPEIVREMCDAARAAGVGPMAAVAGAVAEAVGRALMARSREVIVENGGDIFMATARERVVAVVAPGHKLSGRIGLTVPPAPEGLGVCTSSGRHGHSYSAGQADAAVVVARSAALADAVATAMGNRVQDEDDAAAAVEWALGVDGVIHALVICGETVATAGRLEIVPIVVGEDAGADGT